MVLSEVCSSKLKQVHRLLLIPFVSYMKNRVHLFRKTNANNSFLMSSEAPDKRRILSSGDGAGKSFGFLHWLFVFKYEINIKRILRTLNQIILTYYSYFTMFIVALYLLYFSVVLCLFFSDYKDMEKNIYENLKYNSGLGNCFLSEAKEGAVPRGTFTKT